MHFPWKKMRSTRLSRLVNYHLHNSQKRRDGSSLVVETGFPTSLVDLFIKNREKLKKSSKKKRQSSIPLTTPLADDPAYLAFPPAPAPSPVSPLSSAGSPALSVRCSTDSSLLLPLPLPSPSGDANEILVDPKEDFMEVLKMVLAVCFAVGSKRLTVGITISAILMFFLEYVGIHGCRLLKASGAKGLVRSTVQRICVLLRLKVVKLDGSLMPEIQQDHSLKLGCSSVNNSGSKCLLNTEIQSEIEAASPSCSDARASCQEIESEAVAIKKQGTHCEVVELKRAKSRRAKIRSNVKKIFSEKLRRSRKGHDDSQKLELLEEEKEEKSDFFLCDELEAFHQRSKEDEFEKIDEAIPITLQKVNEETFTESPRKGKESKGGLTWKYFVLCLIVLTGLIGGRAFALLLTLSSCLLFKLSETLPRHTKLPAIRYSSN